MDNSFYEISLSALLEQDLSSYEYFHSLPKDIQRKIENRDISSFEEMQAFVYKEQYGRVENDFF